MDTKQTNQPTNKHQGRELTHTVVGRPTALRRGAVKIAREPERQTDRRQTRGIHRAAGRQTDRQGPELHGDQVVRSASIDQSINQEVDAT